MGKNSAQVVSLRKASEPAAEKFELACQAYDFMSLKAAVDNGADSIHIEYRPTRLQSQVRAPMTRDAGLRKAIRYAHEHKVKIGLCLSQVHAAADDWAGSTALIRDASSLGIDAIELPDTSLMLYAAAHAPNLAIHYQLPDSAEPDVIRLMMRHVPIARVILPRVVSMFQIEEFSRIPGLAVELVGFGKGCAILTRRSGLCGGQPLHFPSSLPSGNCGESAVSGSAFDDRVGPCGSPGQASNDQLFEAGQLDQWHALGMLPQLAAMHVRALRIESQDHSSPRLARLTRVWREAIDECVLDTQHYNVRPAWLAELKNLASST